MRRHASITTAALTLAIAAGCGSHAAPPKQAAAQPPPPSASQAPTPPPAPVASGTARSDKTTFLVRVTATRAAASFKEGPFQAQRAKPGERLIVVKLSETNTGHQPADLENGNTNPVTLTDTTGRTYNTDISWALDGTINPGRTKTVPYVFPVPAGTKPASVTVTLTGDDGNPSTVVLKLP